MRALRRLLDIAVGGACSLLLGGMVAVLAWQVFSRYALNDPSTFSEELLRYGVIWMSLLGAAYATGAGTQMAISLARQCVTGRKRMIIDMLVPLSFIVFSVAVLVIGGLRGVSIASGQTSPVLRLPMPLIYASLPVSGVLMMLYSLLNLVDLARGRGPATEHELAEEALLVGD